jgi:uncharacterized protein (DUF305 family)
MLPREAKGAIAMLNKLVNYRVFGLLVGSTIAALSITYTATAQSHHPLNSPSADVNRTMHQHQPGDQDFLAKLIHHDQKAAEMADLGVQKAKNPALKKLAATIKSEQIQQIDQLQALSKQLYGAQVPTNGMDCMGMQHGQGQGMKSWQNAADFDKEFVQHMIHHQQMSVKMAEKALETATVPQLRQQLQAIIKTQTAEINQLQQLSPTTT